jgi:hypothetical protein
MPGRIISEASPDNTIFSGILAPSLGPERYYVGKTNNHE